MSQVSHPKKGACVSIFLALAIIRWILTVSGHGKGRAGLRKLEMGDRRGVRSGKLKRQNKSWDVENRQEAGRSQEKICKCKLPAHLLPGHQTPRNQYEMEQEGVMRCNCSLNGRKCLAQLVTGAGQFEASYLQSIYYSQMDSSTTI